MTKGFSFYDEFVKIERHENQFDPMENTQLQADLLMSDDLLEFAKKATESQSIAEEELEPFDVEEMEEMPLEDEVLFSVMDVVKETKKSFSQVTKLVALLEEEDYHQFTREEGNIIFSDDELQLVSRLFEKKENFTGTWKQLLSQYFTGE